MVPPLVRGSRKPLVVCSNHLTFVVLFPNCTVYIHVLIAKRMSVGASCGIQSQLRNSGVCSATFIDFPARRKRGVTNVPNTEVNFDLDSGPQCRDDRCVMVGAPICEFPLALCKDC
jgi:hypothetical protein